MADSFFDKIYKDKTQHTPDVLSCLANLSNDEVFTPPDVVNKILDLLPQELFCDPNTTFLDPACKTGVFLREIAKRLLVGLEDKIPDLQQRIDHIFHKQLFGIAITELTSLLSRRSLYCSKYPNGPYSITHFDDAEGNIRYRRINHTWVNGKCKYCGVSKKTALGNENRKTELETHAYEWIHTDNPERLLDMKFDVIISNPPYQLDDGGNGASAKPIYHRFIEQAKKLNPRYLTMIIPARWYAGGKGLDEFRASMLNDDSIVKLIDFVNAKDCFPNLSIGGGICYFLIDRDYHGLCSVTNISNSAESTSFRSLSDHGVFIRYNGAMPILQKIHLFHEETLDTVVCPSNIFGLRTFVRGNEVQDADYSISLLTSAGLTYVKDQDVKSGRELLPKYKVILSYATAEHAGEPAKDGRFSVTSTCKILNPGEICTESYLVLYSTDDYEYARNYVSYLNTKFYRFLLLLSISSIHLSKDKFQFIPIQDFSRSYTDADLNAKYGLSEEEVAFIDGLIKEKV